jgi:hypothetical protein
MAAVGGTIVVVEVEVEEGVDFRINEGETRHHVMQMSKHQETASREGDKATTPPLRE